MSATTAISLILRFAWPMIFSLIAPTLVETLLALDPGSTLLLAVTELMLDSASTQPGGYQSGRKMSALEALFL
jgi:hypothetical protein